MRDNALDVNGRTFARPDGSTDASGNPNLARIQDVPQYATIKATYANVFPVSSTISDVV
jgi:hypothetical protein